MKFFIPVAILLWVGAFSFAEAQVQEIPIITSAPEDTATGYAQPFIREPAKRVKEKIIKKIGFDQSSGTSEMKLNNLNNRLKELGIGQVDDILGTYSLNLYVETVKQIGVALGFSFGVSMENKTYVPNTSLDFNTFTFGPTVYLPVYQINRLNFILITGLRTSILNFNYNNNNLASPDFNSLLKNPQANRYAFHLRSITNDCFSLGGRFQFRFGKKDPQKQQFRVGFDSGYMHAFKTYPWYEPSSKVVVTNMPTVTPDNLYLNLTLSGYFNVN